MWCKTFDFGIIKSFLKKEILTKSAAKGLEMADVLCNQSVHKLSYDTEEYDNHFLNLNEIETINKTVGIYYELLINELLGLI